MRKTKEQGITLMALIITIIVMLVLAAVTIRILVDDGILVQAENATDAEEEAKVKEQVALAFEEANIAYWEERSKGNKIDKTTFYTKEKINELLNKNGAEGKLTQAPTYNETDKTWVVAYKSNNDIEYSFFINKEGQLTSYSEVPSEVDTDIVYLADKAKVGEYVDIGITYENKHGFTSGYTTTTSVLGGWRVLSVSGSGATGKVTVVSSSCPLTYNVSTYNGSDWSGAGATNAISAVENLNNKRITFSSGYTWGFRANGFETNNLENIFGDKSEIVDQESKVHGFTVDEFMAKYQEMTGTTKTLAQMRAVENPLKLYEMKLLARNYWDDRYLDLLNNGQTYALFGTKISNTQLWYVNPPSYNLVGTSDCIIYGVRVVITLQSGFKIDRKNTGDGKTSATAYTISK